MHHNISATAAIIIATAHRQQSCNRAWSTFSDILAHSLFATACPLVVRSFIDIEVFVVNVLQTQVRTLKNRYHDCEVITYASELCYLPCQTICALANRTDSAIYRLAVRERMQVLLVGYLLFKEVKRVNQNHAMHPMMYALSLSRAC